MHGYASRVILVAQRTNHFPVSQVGGGIAWLEDIKEFYRERSEIEKEYSSKLSILAKKYYEKKAKKSSSLSVGDTPTVTPGSLERCVKPQPGWRTAAEPQQCFYDNVGRPAQHFRAASRRTRQVFKGLVIPAGRTREQAARAV